MPKHPKRRGPSRAEAALFSAPLASFSTTRKALVADLRKQGSLAEAAAIAAYKRPTRTAWALNQVAHHEPDKVRAFLAAIEVARQAQWTALKQRDSTSMRVASHELNAAIAVLVASARQAASEDGAHLTATQERTIIQALRALPFADRADVDRLVRGVLVTDIEAAGDATWFGAEESPKAAHDRAPIRSGAKPSTVRFDAAKKRVAARAELARVAREQAETRAREREATRRESAARKVENEAAQLEREATALDERATNFRERANVKRREAQRLRLRGDRLPPARTRRR